MTDTYRDWPEKWPLALWGYRTSIRTSTGATPYSLIYGMEAVLPVELEVPSLRVALESEIPEAEWTRGRFEQLNLLEEQRLKALHHTQGYQKRIAKAFQGKDQTCATRGSGVKGLLPRILEESSSPIGVNPM